MIQQQQQQKQLKKQKVIKTFKILSNKQETHQHIKGEKKKKNFVDQTKIKII